MSRGKEVTMKKKYLYLMRGGCSIYFRTVPIKLDRYGISLEYVFRFCPNAFSRLTGIKLKKGEQVRIPVDKLLKIVEKV